MADLMAQFDQAMFDIYRRAKSEASYNASFFLQMLADQGGLATAKRLINSEQESQGYTNLQIRQRLDLTVEALVIEDKRWHTLFTPEELEKARQRLKKYGYSAKA